MDRGGGVLLGFSIQSAKTHVLFWFFRGFPDRRVLSRTARNTVDERNPFRTTWKPWETLECWYLPGNRIFRNQAFLGGADSRMSQPSAVSSACLYLVCIGLELRGVPSTLYKNPMFNPCSITTTSSNGLLPSETPPKKNRPNTTISGFSLLLGNVSPQSDPTGPGLERAVLRPRSRQAEASDYAPGLQKLLSPGEGGGLSGALVLYVAPPEMWKVGAWRCCCGQLWGCLFICFF